jgi:hypothetical protein
VLLAALVSAACAANTYCQSGSKYGTKCYSGPAGDNQPHEYLATEADGEGGGSADDRDVPATTPR